MPRRKAETAEDTATFANLGASARGVVVDAMQPRDTKIRSREAKEFAVDKKGVKEPIVRTNIR